MKDKGTLNLQHHLVAPETPPLPACIPSLQPGELSPLRPLLASSSGCTVAGRQPPPMWTVSLESCFKLVAIILLPSQQLTGEEEPTDRQVLAPHPSQRGVRVSRGQWLPRGR